MASFCPAASFAAACVALVGVAPRAAIAQQPAATVSITVRTAAGLPIAFARVTAEGATTPTDADGMARLALPAGRRVIVGAKLGFRPDTATLLLLASGDTAIDMRLLDLGSALDAVLITATRAERSPEAEPTRVEVIPPREVNEEVTLHPGEVARLLGEASGIRIQTTSAAFGGAGVRILGLQGRYTQFLIDGMPLTGAQTTSLAPLQISPLDLEQVEIIRGAASALYGPAALGGVVDLISRRPGAHARRDGLVNVTSLGASDAVLFASGPLSPAAGYTILGSANRQPRRDIDRDGWTDVAGYRRAVVRPRLFLETDGGHTMRVTAGATVEDREGGSMPGRNAPDGQPFPQTLDTRRFDAGAVARVLLRPGRILNLRASLTEDNRRRATRNVVERERQHTSFAEAALTSRWSRYLLIAGGAVQRETFRPRDVPRFAFSYTVPAAFAQYDVETSRATLSASGRADFHSAFGTLASPRLALLLRPRECFAVRLSAGSGSAVPTPLVDDVEELGLSRVGNAAALRPERARNFTADATGPLGPLSLSVTLFGAEIESALRVRPDPLAPGLLEIYNAAGVARTRGSEATLRLGVEALQVALTHFYIDATEPSPGGTGRRREPLTPRHSASLLVLIEEDEAAEVAAAGQGGAPVEEGEMRVGFELFYTGAQALDDNPYRFAGRPYFEVGLLVERAFGRARVFLNGENLTNVRQTRFDPLVRPTPGAGGRLTTDVWAPLAGRVVNGGVRLAF